MNRKKWKAKFFYLISRGSEETYFMLKNGFFMEGRGGTVTKIKRMAKMGVLSLLKRNQKDLVPALGTPGSYRLTGLKRPYNLANELLEYEKIYWLNPDENPYWIQQMEICQQNQVLFEPRRNGKECIKTVEKQRGKTDSLLVITSDYRLYRKYTKKMNIYFYHDPIWLFNQHKKPDIKGAYKNVYDSIMGRSLFSGKYEHGLFFVHALLSVAPIWYHFFEKISKAAEKNHEKVLFLCEKTDIVGELYETYFGQACYLDWTMLAGYEPKSEVEWYETVSDMPILDEIPKDRLEYARGGSSLCKNTVHEYIKGIEDRDEEWYVVNPYGGTKMIKELLEYLPRKTKISGVSFEDYVSVSKEVYGQSLNVVQNVRPVLVGIYADRFAYALPQERAEWKDDVVKSAIKTYVEEYRKMSTKENSEGPSKEDIRNLLDFSRSTLCWLRGDV